MPAKLKKILIIEDEAALINNLALALSDDYEVISAANGKEGLRRARNEAPDLILLDIILPDMNGIEILRKLKREEKTSDIPIIILTNLGDKETISKILQAGGKEYLVKADWSIDGITKKIEQILKR